MINFIKNKKNIILSSSILNGINTFSIFCTDENKKIIDIVVIYKGYNYIANNIEVTKNNFTEPDQRMEFIKANKDKFISGKNTLNCTDLIKEVSEIGKWEGYWVEGKDEFTLESHITNDLKYLKKATIGIEDYIELKYIRTDKKLKIQDLENKIENGVVKFFNDNKNNELDTNWVRDKIKGLLKSKCNIDVNDDIFIFDKNADENGIIKESCTLKINFPDSLIEGNPDPKPKDPKDPTDPKNPNSSNNNSGSSSSENNKKTKSCYGS